MRRGGILPEERSGTGADISTGMDIETDTDIGTTGGEAA
jgi:hypothetical protein